MSKAIICTGGGAPTTIPQGLAEKGDYIIAADSGYDTGRKLGLSMDICIGDFDSTAFSSEIQKLAFEKSLRDKDESDTELAIRKAVSLGLNEYILIGGGGYRMDHLFCLFALFDQYGPPKLWYTAYETLILVTGYQRFESLGAGKTVSFLPCSFSKETSVTAKQLHWPLENYQLSMTNISLSNRTNDTFLDVFVKQGNQIFVSFPIADK